MRLTTQTTKLEIEFDLRIATVDLKTGLPSNARPKILELQSGESVACA
jgi:hypothetical protein